MLKHFQSTDHDGHVVGDPYNIAAAAFRGAGTHEGIAQHIERKFSRTATISYAEESIASIWTSTMIGRMLLGQLAEGHWSLGIDTRAPNRSQPGTNPYRLAPNIIRPLW